MAGLLVLTAGTAQAAATTVPLGTAGAYAILAGSGITNTGITTISGDVGSSPTASETRLCRVSRRELRDTYRRKPHQSEPE